MLEKTILPILLGEFHNKINNIQNMVIRDACFLDAPGKIMVAIGMRRAGKTYFLYQQILKMLQLGISKTSILYINFEDDRLLPLDQHAIGRLVDAFYSLYPENHERKCYLFFDEIQTVDQWSTVIRRLHDSKNVEIFLTGSSAKLLSKEIATNLRGRSLATEIWPYSFNEFLRARKADIDKSLFDQKTNDNLEKLFHHYLSHGGFPEVTTYAPDARRQTLQDYLDLVIFRDIIERHNIKNPAVIKYMALAMLHNVSKPFTINKFYNDLKSLGYSVGKDILYDYADYLEDAYLTFSVSLFSKSIRKVHTNPQKLYAIDPGMIRALTLDYENDLGRLFENIIYLELRQLGCKINYYLTHERHEIDFIAQTPHGSKKLFQVAWHTDDKKTLEREERALAIGMKELGIDGELITLRSYLQHGIRL